MRAFVAVELNEEVKGKIAALQADLPSGIKRVEPANLHLTLAFLGEIDDVKAEEVATALDAVSAIPFEAKCLGVGVFPSMNFVRVVWVGIREGAHALSLLHAHTSDALAPLGFKKDEFSPHITIGRPKARVDVREFIRRHEDDEFGSFLVDKLVLKKSTLTPQGPIYETVHEKRLG